MSTKRKLVTFDWALKNLLRDKSNFDILEGFLSELLKNDITIIDILESEANKKTEKDKFNRVDLLAKDSTETLILIEVQYQQELDYFHRILFGASKLITEYISESEAYKNIKKVITVSIVHFDIGKGEDYIYEGFTTFKGIHKNDILGLSENQKKMFNMLEIKDIYPEHFIIKTRDFDNKIKDTLDEWIYFLKNGEIKENFHAKNIGLAAKKLNILKLDEKERKKYDNYIEDLRFQYSVFETARFEGLQEGVEKGKVEGRKQGEKQKAIEIAKQMLKDKLPVETILKYTNLTKEEINNLK